MYEITDTIRVNWGDLFYFRFLQVVMITLLYTVPHRCSGLYPSVMGILGGLTTKALENHP